MNRTVGRRTLAALLALVAVAAVAPAAEAMPKKKAKPADSNVTVMTRNLYLGTDLIKIATAPDIDAFRAAVAAGFAEVKATNFPARAKLIAKEVKQTRPDLIGLQEAALWRTGPIDGSATPNATTVAYDYVKLLARALKRQGLKYKVVHATDEADIEGPSSEGYDVRLTMRDAILVRTDRKGLKVGRKGGANFTARIPFPTVGGVFDVRRGYAWADVRLNGKPFRFVDTHLEAYLEGTRVAQAKQLVGKGGPVKGQRVIVLGDMNSDPKGAGGSPPSAYDALIAGGLRDVWPATNKRNPGYACCLRTTTLTDPPSPLPWDHRIDQIFVKGKVKPVSSKMTGINPRTSRTKAGLWASDHGGVVAKVRLR